MRATASILDTWAGRVDIFEAGNSSDDNAGRLAHLRLQIDDVHLSHLKRFQAVLTGIENLAADNQVPFGSRGRHNGMKCRLWRS